MKPKIINSEIRVHVRIWELIGPEDFMRFNYTIIGLDTYASRSKGRRMELPDMGIIVHTSYGIQS